MIANDHLPEVLTLARSPDYWSERFREKGLRMSARTLREKAIKSGLCYHVDKQVLISPRQIDELFVWSNASWGSRPTSVAGSTGSPAPSRRGKASSAYTRALAKLTKSKRTKSA